MSINLANLKIVKIANKTIINGKPLEIIEFRHKDGSMITRKEMKAICKSRQASMKKKFKNGIISVSIEYSARWYSADTSYLNEDINYFTLDDYDEYENDPGEYVAFRFMFIESVKPAEGGADLHNDCLAKALIRSLGFHKSKFLIVPEELKEILGLERNDLIPISSMEEVENYFNDKLNTKNDINAYSIFVTGDHCLQAKEPLTKRFI